jgi:NADH-quinone oxidoreductase subunit L
MLAATLAIAGIPLFSGFFSKDEILWKSFSSDYGHPILWIAGAITAALTAFYMFRLIYLTFHGKGRYDAETEHHIHESPRSMTIPLVVLAVLSVIGGWIGWPAALAGGAWFQHWLHPVFAQGQELLHSHEAAHHSHWQEYLLMVITVALVIVMILLARRFYVTHPGIAGALREKFSGIHKLVYNKYYVDEAYDLLFVRSLVNGSYLLWQKFDLLIVDGFFNGSAWLTGRISAGLRKVQTGMIRSYAFALLLGAVFVIGYLMLSR